MKYAIGLFLLTFTAWSQCDPIEQCNYTFTLTDSAADGWDGNYFEIWQDGLVATLGPQLQPGMATVSVPVSLCMGEPYYIVRGEQTVTHDEISLSLVNTFGVSIYSYPQMQVNHEPQYFGTAVCTADDCQPPIDLQVFEYDGSPKLHWTAGGDSPWEVYIVPADSAAPGVESQGIISGCPFDLANYMDQPYDIYVRTHCFWGGTSEWQSLLGYNMILAAPKHNGPNFSVYPVPANEALTIKPALFEKWTGWITDSTGRKILQIEGDGDAREYYVSNLRCGIYYVTINFESGIRETRAILLR